MNTPDFFNQVPTITMYDPLSKLLGAVDDGMITYSYVDAVKLAGHSCPTVAGAYLMALHGIKALYEDEIPVRVAGVHGVELDHVARIDARGRAVSEVVVRKSKVKVQVAGGFPHLTDDLRDGRE